MLGRRDPQRKLFTTNTLIGEEALAKMGFHGVLAQEGHRLFCDEDFAAIYSTETGRPSVPPSVLALATLLQYFDRVSDAEVLERCRYDLRWKAALHLDLHSIDAPFAKSIKGSAEVDWQDKADVDRFLGELLEDCSRAARLAEEAGCAGEEVSLLRRVKTVVTASVRPEWRPRAQTSLETGQS